MNAVVENLPFGAAKIMIAVTDATNPANICVYTDNGFYCSKVTIGNAEFTGRDLLKSIDFDGNGYIEYEEFIRVTLSKEQLFTDVNLKTAFDKTFEEKRIIITSIMNREILNNKQYSAIHFNNINDIKKKNQWKIGKYLQILIMMISKTSHQKLEISLRKLCQLQSHKLVE